MPNKVIEVRLKLWNGNAFRSVSLPLTAKLSSVLVHRDILREGVNVDDWTFYAKSYAKRKSSRGMPAEEIPQDRKLYEVYKLFQNLCGKKGRNDVPFLELFL